MKPSGITGPAMDKLISGQRLAINQTLQSNNGRYQVVMQGDGNLVLYEGIPHAPRAVWSTGTWSLPIGYRPTYAEMQGDGNFVLYNNARVPAWSSSTWGNPGSRIVLQDDRNFVLYGPNNNPLWASHTYVAPEPTEIHAHKEDQVGWGKKIVADATLYRDGRLVVDSWQQNDNWTGGLRGEILLLCVDG